MTLSVSCCHSLFSALYPHWEGLGAAVRPSFTFPHPGSAPQLAGLPLEVVVARSSSPTLHPVPSPRHWPVWKQSWPLPFPPHPPTALSSHTAIFNPDWSLDSRGLLLLPTETDSGHTELTPAFSGFPKPFSTWAAQLHLLEASPR